MRLPAPLRRLAALALPALELPDPGMTPTMTVHVQHNESRQRFEATVDGHLCVADYALRGGVMWMPHTEVPPAVGGRGIAAELVRAALAWAEEKGYRVQPSCSYVAAYMRRNPETLKLLAR
jgi:predicted GNAT family acetyltransferase